MQTTTKTSWFAPKLRKALADKSMSVRALARVWRPDEAHETSRRSINRYLNKGIVPSVVTRRELADAIGVDPSEFEPTPDDEELPMSFADGLQLMIEREISRGIKKALAEMATT